MVAAKLQAFGGMIPAQDDTLLPEMHASYAENVWLRSGTLDAFRQPTVVFTAGSTAITRAYRIPKGNKSKEYISDSYWLQFQNADTWVVESPIANDTFGRRYWAPDALGPRYTTLARVIAAQTPYVLGIPAPSTAPGLSVAGGSGTTISRAYVYTWVSSMGEEGPPSPPVVVNGFVNGTWNVTMTAPTSGDTTNRALDKARIYRTITSSAGVATYFFVAELPIATTAYADTLSDTAVSAANQLQSTGWTAPPTDLQGIVAMPNGILAGWRANELWFCEPYRPHAWPVAYTNSVDARIVGLGVIGQSVVVCTETGAYLATGTNPANIALSKVAGAEPCLSQGSILSTPQGVYYASQNGMMLVSPGGTGNVLRSLFQSDVWQSLFNVPGLKVARLGNALFSFGSVATGCFDPGAFDPGRFEQVDFSGSRDGFYIDTEDMRVALTLLYSATPTNSTWNDPWSGEVLCMRNGQVLHYDTGELTRQVFKWRSKKFQLTEKRNLGAIKVYFTVPSGTPDLITENTSQSQSALGANQWGLLRVYADDRLVYTRELRRSGELFRLPSGYQVEFWQVEIEARVVVTNIQLGNTPKELQGV
jgi:hypothetical protein